MAIITAAGLTDLSNQRAFNKNGSTVTLKKISDTEWILFGDLAEGDSEGFVTNSHEEEFVLEFSASSVVWEGYEQKSVYATNINELPFPITEKGDNTLKLRAWWSGSSWRTFGEASLALGWTLKEMTIQLLGESYYFSEFDSYVNDDSQFTYSVLYGLPLIPGVNGQSVTLDVRMVAIPPMPPQPVA